MAHKCLPKVSTIKIIYTECYLYVLLGMHTIAELKIRDVKCLDIQPDTLKELDHLATYVYFLKRTNFDRKIANE